MVVDLWEIVVYCLYVGCEMYVKVICAMCVGGCDCGFVVAVGCVVCGLCEVM